MTILPFARHGLALVCLSLLACGGDGNTQPVDGGGSLDGGSETDASEPVPEQLNAGAGQLALRVDRARQHVSAGSPGYLEVQFTLANGAGAAPASLNPALFQVKTAAG